MTRVVSGVVLAAVALAAILFLPFLALRLVAVVVAAFAAAEYVKVVGADEVAAAGALAACWAVADGSAASLAAVALIVLVLAIVAVMVRNATMHAAAAGAFATVYIGMPLGMLAAVQKTFGPSVTLLLLGTIVVSDTAQYYTGRALGRHPLAPTISPKKTIEGAIGGLIFGTLFIVVVGAHLYGLPMMTAVPFGLAVVGLGIVGDLFESRLKRTAGVKDSSNVIPGHGGVLDRIDALLFAAPAFYLYFKA
jgi:phosphatidate cytidylyltransferase